MWAKAGVPGRLLPENPIATLIKMFCKRYFLLQKAETKLGTSVKLFYSLSLSLIELSWNSVATEPHRSFEKRSHLLFKKCRNQGLWYSGFPGNKKSLINNFPYALLTADIFPVLVENTRSRSRDPELTWSHVSVMYSTSSTFGLPAGLSIKYSYGWGATSWCPSKITNSRLCLQ